jgi:hypothetical protein
MKITRPLIDAGRNEEVKSHKVLLVNFSLEQWVNIVIAKTVAEEHPATYGGRWRCVVDAGQSHRNRVAINSGAHLHTCNPPSVHIS